MIEFSVIGEPRPKGSKRGFVVSGRAVLRDDNLRSKPWSERVHWTAREHAPADGPLQGPVSVFLSFRMRVPSQVPKERRGRPAVKPDLDKLVRCVLDALSGVLWVDDGQVCRLEAWQHYDHEQEGSGVDVIVVPMDCWHVANRRGCCRWCGESSPAGAS